MPLEPRRFLSVPSPAVFAYCLGIFLEGLAHSSIVWLVQKSNLAVCTVMCLLSAALDGVLGSHALDLRVVSDLCVLAHLSSALRQLIDEIGLLSIVDASSIDLVLSCVGYYGNDEVDWCVADFRYPFTLYGLAAERVHPLLQEIVPGRKHAPGHCLCNERLSPVLVRYRERPSLTLHEAAWIVRDFLGR